MCKIYITTIIIVIGIQRKYIPKCDQSSPIMVKFLVFYSKITKSQQKILGLYCLTRFYKISHKLKKIIIKYFYTRYNQNKLVKLINYY